MSVYLYACMYVYVEVIEWLQRIKKQATNLRDFKVVN